MSYVGLTYELLRQSYVVGAKSYVGYNNHVGLSKSSAGVRISYVGLNISYVGLFFHRWHEYTHRTYAICLTLDLTGHLGIALWSSLKLPKVPNVRERCLGKDSNERCGVRW